MIDDDVKELITRAGFDSAVKSLVSLHELDERAVHAFDVVFLDPQWGGQDYQSQECYPISNLSPPTNRKVDTKVFEVLFELDVQAAEKHKNR